jgi:hypothetical protein
MVLSWIIRQGFFTQWDINILQELDWTQVKAIYACESKYYIVVLYLVWLLGAN